MSFQRKVYKLVWPKESRWHGLEVRLRGMNIGGLRMLSSIDSEKSNIEQAEAMFDVIGQGLISWNLADDDGNPVPVEDFRGEDMAMLMAIVNAWQEVVADVPAPLPQTSSDGGKSEEALIPMEIPSASHPSLNTQS